jgi:hypothetical protein
MTEAIRNLLLKAKQIDSRDERNPIIEKALRRLDNLAKRIDPARFGKKGGMKTAERGPEYFKRIAAMRKTRGGGRPRKQVD